MKNKYEGEGPTVVGLLNEPISDNCVEGVRPLGFGGNGPLFQHAQPIRHEDIVYLWNVNKATSTACLLI